MSFSKYPEKNKEWIRDSSFWLKTFPNLLLWSFAKNIELYLKRKHWWLLKKCEFLFLKIMSLWFLLGILSKYFRHHQTWILLKENLSRTNTTLELPRPWIDCFIKIIRTDATFELGTALTKLFSSDFSILRADLCLWLV